MCPSGAFFTQFSIAGRAFRVAVCLCLLAGAAAGCATPPGAPALPGSAPAVVKIGLIAPFEGLGRPLGYGVLPAVQIAVDEANAATGAGDYKLALAAVNDDDDPAEALTQTLVLAQDPAVLAVLGPWNSAGAEAAAPGYARLGLPAAIPAALGQAAPGVVSLCPGADRVAQTMLDAAAPLGQPVALAGPAGALRDALAARGVVEAGANPAAGTTVMYAGDAAGAADLLVQLQRGGWSGAFVGGPDADRPWLAGRAGAAVPPQAWALVCAPGTGSGGLSSADAEKFATQYQARTGTAASAEATLAYWGARRLIAAIAADTQAHGHPTRAGTAAALSADGAEARVARVELMR